MAERRIGLLGGTFNPVHCGHIRAAMEVRRRFGLDRVLLVPSAQPPHKGSTGMASAGHRLNMVKLACRGRAGLSASALEIEAGGTSYSVLTLDKVRRLRPRAVIVFVMGVDAFLEIETWREYRRLLEQCHFVVTSRPGFDLRRARNVLEGALRKRLVVLEPGEEKVRGLPPHPRVFLLPIPALDISSTDIRRRARRGESLSGRVPRAVETYIRRQGLYQGGQ